MMPVKQSEWSSADHKAAYGALVYRSRFGKLAKLPDRTVHRIVENIAIALVVQLKLRRLRS
jgi:hypothetical protein